MDDQQLLRAGFRVILDAEPDIEVVDEAGDGLEAVRRTQLSRPDVVREIWRMLVATKKAMPPPADGIDTHPFGLEANRKNLELIIQYSWEQQMLPRKMSVDELFTDLTANLVP